MLNATILIIIAFISNNVPSTVNSEGYMQTSNKHRNSLFKNLELYNLSFLKLNQLIVDGDVETNPGPVTNRVNNTPIKGRPKKTGFRGTPKKLKFEKVVSLDNIAPWSVSCPSTNLFSNHAFEVNPEINAKVSLWKGDITKIDVNAIMNASKESLLGGRGIDKSIHDAAGK